MLDDQTPADTPPAKPAGNPWPPLPEPFDVEHVTMSGGIFGGLDVIRGEYIDRPRPRRGWLRKLFRHP
ncbi:MAG TPA: hypothetical protein VII53_02335 [Solirubrobacteraceae bacterium]